MGLGKTVQILALLSHPVDGALKNNHTLIVCPLTLLDHWATHIAKFLPSFKVIVHNSSSHKIASSQIADKSIPTVVLTTYGAVRSEYGSGSGASRSTLFQHKWGRIVLDEAHNIKSSKSQAAVSCCHLEAEVRWVVTGTPLQNRLDDFYSILKFLRFHPFDEKHWWRGLIINLLRARDVEGIVRFAMIVKRLCLRRKKTDSFAGKPLLVLPPIEIEVKRVEQTPKEKQVYASLKDHVGEKMKEMLQSSHSDVLINALVLLLRLRQTADDLRLVEQHVDIKKILAQRAGSAGNSGEVVASLTLEELEVFTKILAGAPDETCAVCLNPVYNAVALKCRHVFCQECTNQLLETHNVLCPLCRANLVVALKASELQQAEENEGGAVKGKQKTKEQDNEDELLGSKCLAVREIVQQVLDRSSEEKVVVFSQWPQMLRLVQRSLPCKTAMLDGSMSLDLRNKNLSSFNSESDVRVMLLSTMAGGTGLNLTVASTCVIVDPWWNPAIDRQAMMRVHRIGQTRKVQVFQLLGKDTVDEKVWNLQQKKQRLIDQTIDASASGSGGEVPSRQGKGSSSVSMSLNLDEVRDLLL